MPFKESKSKYTTLSSDGLIGNHYFSDQCASILRAIHLVNTKRLDIKYLIIDDFGYMITNSFMRKVNQKGYDKYNEIGNETFMILEAVSNLRDDLFCFVMMHTEIDQQGRYKPKTAGKMIDQYICVEGKFSYVLHALTNEGNYQFLTNNDGRHMAKTPLDMFSETFIPNDLLMVANAIKDY